MAKHYGGILEDSPDGGKAAYSALVNGGTSTFNALFGGGRQPDGLYERMEAHGFYWSASETSFGNAVFYNFGKGGLALNRQLEGDKRMGLAVRCVNG